MTNSNELPRFITDRRTGLRYELVGDYYLLSGEDESEEKPHIGKWGWLRDDYLQNSRRPYRTALKMSGELPAHLADVEQQAEELFSQTVKQLAEKEGVTEALKAADQMEWVRRMESVANRAEEIVLSEVIYV